MRKATLLALACMVAVSACSTSGAAEEWRNGPVPTCDTTSRGRLLLMAQSVPSATLIPYVGDLPPGWDFTRAHSRSSESVLVFTTDTFDLDVHVALSDTCQVSAAQPVDSSRPGTQLFVGDDGKTFSFLFEGGCIEFDYATKQLAESSEGLALIEAVPFMSRDTLRQLSSWTL